MSIKHDRTEKRFPLNLSIARSGEPNMAKNKTTESKCPVTRQQFLKAAKPLTLTIDGKSIVASVKEFKTGSFGRFKNDKQTVEIDVVACKIQPSISLVIVGSKDAE
jgi:hypothetical protein